MGSSIEIRDAAFADVEYVASRIREADRLEVEAFSGGTIHEALMRGFRESEVVLTATIDDEPCCMFGFSAASMLSDTGVPWLLGTELVRALPVQFLRESKRVVDFIWSSGRYTVLENWIDAENAVSMKWLPWLGFTITDQAIERRGRTFYRFEKTGD